MAIAQPLYLYFLSTLLCVLSYKASSNTSSRGSSSNNHGSLKYLHLTFYQHDTYNKTTYLTARGVVGPGVTATTSPFGTLYANQDPLTVTPDPSSEVVGTAEGLSITTSFDGLHNIVVQKVNLQTKDHKGSLTAIGNGNSINPSDISIVGGTGDFLFVQGLVKSTLIDVKGYALIYKADFHLYWPPYPNKASSNHN